MSGQMPTASEVLHDEEIMRIHELWQQTKAELKLKARELAELEHARALEGEQLQAEHANGMREMQAICVELRDKNRGLETQLQGAHDEIRRLSGLLEESNRKAREAHGRVEQQAALASSGEQQVRELHQSLRALERDRKEVIDRSYADVRRLEEQLAQKDQAIAALEAQARNATQSVRAARDEHAGEVERAREQQRRLEDADASNRELSKQLGATREQLKYLQLARRNEAQLHAVVQQLQADNARLVKVLAATDEFRDFVEYADDSGGLSYVTPAAGGAGALARAESVVADDMPVRGARREGALWVPSDAFTLANEFRHTHAPHVGSDVFADLLLKLNAVWRQREQRALARLRQRHADERQRLLRRSKNREPYTTIVQAAEVERLKRELRVVRLGVGSGRRRLNETEERLLESSLAAVESLSAQVCAPRERQPHAPLVRTAGHSRAALPAQPAHDWGVPCALRTRARSWLRSRTRTRCSGRRAWAQTPPARRPARTPTAPPPPRARLPTWSTCSATRSARSFTTSSGARPRCGGTRRTCTSRCSSCRRGSLRASSAACTRAGARREATRPCSERRVRPAAAPRLTRAVAATAPAAAAAQGPGPKPCARVAACAGCCRGHDALPRRVRPLWAVRRRARRGGATPALRLRR